MTLRQSLAGCLALLAGAATLACQTSIPAAQAAKTTPFGGKPHAIPGLIEAEHFDDGPPGIAHKDQEPENQGADYRAGHVDIEQRGDASNGYGIGWTRAGEWLVYSVEVKQTGTYTIEFPVASNKKGGTFHIELDGVDVTGPIDVPDTGSWQKLEMIEKENVTLKQGRYLLKLCMDTQGESGSIADIDYMKFILQH